MFPSLLIWQCRLCRYLQMLEDHQILAQALQSQNEDFPPRVAFRFATVVVLFWYSPTQIGFSLFFYSRAGMGLVMSATSGIHSFVNINSHLPLLAQNTSIHISRYFVLFVSDGQSTSLRQTPLVKVLEMMVV